ncbi:MAG TPA: SAM-dependent chlorinase/fluorinase [Candidatus Accumulibacter phosphatis]|nr:MAG: S-adenosyl-l-methionine hydroxide adenosyltransferase [Candidatus Accumulibacter sp. SK-11]HAY27621.1 hypothetical protein [Accumulibacter sp.]HCN66762.1 hypothetical protein [Accumulibacter sp.]HRL75585.1 SAM-dependent chlorinase/fluorinase [Candidatus Accumulibacter phosphatis]HRQ93782.1 SAM-dependent chlorinase/fluorinase [Candidatus Accumulibacter phosphatis]
MIVLFTDFGIDDPYVGQMKAVLLRVGRADMAIVDLLHRVPDFAPRAGAHLLAALQAGFDRGSVFLAVVDPGVGSDRPAVVLEADGKYYVGPDNGLLAVVAARAREQRSWRIVWHPERLSASFHGRDLFAPVAARIASGDWPVAWLAASSRLQHVLPADDLAEVIYIDHYGNAMTGMRAAKLPPQARLCLCGRAIPPARVFAEAAAGEAFWYENSVGLVEVAVNRGSAASLLRLAPGSPVAFAD